MEKKIIQQIMKIKSSAVSLMFYQKDRLTINERATLDKLYNLMDSYLCEKLEHKRCTAEELLDSSLIEISMILKRTRNTEVKRLVKTLEAGIKW